MTQEAEEIFTAAMADSRMYVYEYICEALGISLVRVGGIPFLVNQGTSSEDLAQQLYFRLREGVREFDLEKYFPSAIKAGEVIELDNGDYFAVIQEMDAVNKDWATPWPTVEKYLQRIR